ncbi:MAG: hypothetical protein K0U52_11705 [Gammaproteobacteria bacterium]|nr:hypothetical protein [Gammaproteobacteria bacterium]
MNYATWKLNFANPKYGTGPEDTVAELSATAEGGWVSGQAENDGTILGYVSGVVDTTALNAWSFTYLTKAKALNFCKAINPEAYLLEDGRITAPIPESI